MAGELIAEVQSIHMPQAGSRDCPITQPNRSAIQAETTNPPAESRVGQVLLLPQGPQIVAQVLAEAGMAATKEEAPMAPPNATMICFHQHWVDCFEVY